MSMAIKRASYTGDPGLFGDIFKGIGGAVGGFLTGGPMGAIGGAVRGFKGPPQAAGPGSVPTRAQLATQTGQLPKPGIVEAIRRAVPGGETGMFPAMNGMKGATAGGYHLNKSDYFLKTGEYIPAGSRWVKNRKRNPANARATSRAISRVSGAKTYAKSLSRITIRKKC